MNKKVKGLAALNALLQGEILEYMNVLYRLNLVTGTLEYSNYYVREWKTSNVTFNDFLNVTMEIAEV